MSKKKIIAIVMFIFIGLFMFTFAGTDDGLNAVDETLNEYEIQFQNYDGSILQTALVTEGEDAVYTGPTPTRPEDALCDYEFTGWGSDLVNIQDSAIAIAQYACDTKEYTVTFVDFNNTLLANVTVEAGGTAVYPNATPTRTNFIFTGWSGGLTNVLTDFTVTALYANDANNNGIIDENESGAPTITLSENNIYQMLVYGTIPAFSATATDDGDGVVPVTIDSSAINPNVPGIYPIIFTAQDTLGNTSQLTANFEVLRRPITVQILDETSIYGDAIKTLSYNVISGEEVAANKAGINLSTEPTLTNRSNVGNYSIKGIANNSNYIVTFVNGNYEITALKVPVVWGNTTLTYNTKEQFPTATFINVDKGTTTLSVHETNGKTSINVATDYNATATTTDSNYILTNETTNYVIEAKDLTEDDLIDLNKDFKFEGDTFEFDGNKHSLSVENLPAGFTVSYKGNEKTNANTYTVTATIKPDATNSNYKGSVKLTADMVITPKEVAVDWENTKLTYTGKEQFPTASFKDVNNNKITLKVKETTNKVSINADNYNASVTTTKNNYTFTNTSVDYVIEAKNLTEKDLTDLSKNFKFKNDTFEFDGNKHSLSVKNLPAGFVASYEGNEKIDANTYEVKATIKPDATNTNYTGSVELKATMTITQKEVKVNWSNTKLTYTGSEIFPTATFKDVNNRDITLAVSEANGKTSINAATDYKAKATNTDSNYKLKNDTADYKIIAKTLTKEDLIKLNEKFEFKGNTFEFNGNQHSLSVNNLPDGFEVSYKGNEKTNAGTYTVTATIKPKATNPNYKGSVELTADMVITPKEVAVNWTNTSLTYNGKEQFPTATYTNVKGKVKELTVKETNDNESINKGDYNATAIVPNGNYTLKNATSPYTINAKTLTEDDITGVTFNGDTFEYDGNAKNLTVSNIPAGFEAVYGNNNQTEADTYTVTAKIVPLATNTNYTGEVILTPATMVIRPKEVAVNWSNTSLTYTGGEQFPDATYTPINNVPVILNVKETNGTESINKGNYNATAEMVTNDSNYTLTNTTSPYTIGAKTLTEDDITGVTFSGNTFEYDGNAKNLTVSNIPAGFKAVYGNNNQTEADTYTVTAKIVPLATNTNYTGEISLPSATMVITPKEVAVNWGNTNLAYDGTEQFPAAFYTPINNIPVVLNVKETNGTESINKGNYNATAEMVTNDSNYTLTNTTKDYTIGAKTLTEDDITGVTFNGDTFEYDGNAKNLTVSNIPAGFEAVYGNNNQTEADTYTVTAKIVPLATNTNYTGEVILTPATMVIRPKEVAVNWSNTSLTYDGTEQFPDATYTPINNIPVVLNVKETNGTESINKGDYNATAEMITNDSNYTLTNTTKDYTIGAKTLTEDDITGVTFSGDTFEYDGNAKNLTVSNIPAGFKAVYGNNNQTEADTYTVTAKIVPLATNTNYTGEISLPSATMVITPKEVAVNWGNTNLTYDGTEQFPAAFYTPINNIPVVLNVKETNGTESINKGNYNATAEMVTNDSNYTLTNTTKDYTIGAKTLTEDDITGVTFSGDTFEYDGNAKNLTVSNIPAGFEAVYGNNNQTEADTYTVTAKIVPLATNTNYTGEISLPSATMVITPKEVAVNWTNTSLTYDGTEQFPDATYTPINNVPVVLNVKETNDNESINKGDYNATAEMITNDSNYTLTNTTEDYTIGSKTLSEADLNVTFNSQTFLFDNTLKTITASGLDTTLFEITSYTGNTRTDIGSNEATVTIAPLATNENYTGSVTLRATIAVRATNFTISSNWNTKDQGKQPEVGETVSYSIGLNEPGYTGTLSTYTINVDPKLEIICPTAPNVSCDLTTNTITWTPANINETLNYTTTVKQTPAGSNLSTKVGVATQVMGETKTKIEDTVEVKVNDNNAESIDVVLALDVSGSMICDGYDKNFWGDVTGCKKDISADRLDAMLSVTNQFIDNLVSTNTSGAKINLSIITFGKSSSLGGTGTVVTELENRLLNSGSVSSVKTTVTNLTNVKGGGTPLYGALETMTTILNSGSGAYQYGIVLADGHPTDYRSFDWSWGYYISAQDQQNRNKIVNKLKKTQAELYTVGFDIANDTSAQAILKTISTSYYDASNATSLNTVFNTILAKIEPIMEQSVDGKIAVDINNVNKITISYMENGVQKGGDVALNNLAANNITKTATGYSWNIGAYPNGTDFKLYLYNR